MASQEEKEDTSLKCGEALAIAEDALGQVVGLIARGHQQGMIDKPERDTFANDTQAIRHMVLSLHSRLTAVSVRNGADGVHILGGPGR